MRHNTEVSRELTDEVKGTDHSDKQYTDYDKNERVNNRFSAYDENIKELCNNEKTV